MIINNNGVILNQDDFTRYIFGEIEHYIKGFFYIPGFVAGKDSVNYVNEQISQGKEIPFEHMMGNFLYCIRNINGETFFFSSNSNMSCVYYSSLGASSSYLQLMNLFKSEGEQLTFSLDSVCEYFTTGNIFFGKTLTNEINLLSNDCYVKWGRTGMTVHKKNISDMDGESDIISPDNFFNNLAFSLQNENVSLSLTGGYDSRAIYSQMRDRINLKLFFSSNIDSSKDMDRCVAERVATAVGDDLEIIATEKPVISEKFIKDIIWITDGIQPLALESGIRIRNFRKALTDQGYTIQLSGDGGVLHKDWEWMQDLPFYHKRYTNTRRYYRQRIEFSRINIPFSGKAKDSYLQQEKRFISKLKSLTKGINTESYDFFYYYVNGNRQTLYNVDNSGYIAYAPFIELDFVRYSYHLPRRKRFFYMFLREMTTKANKTIAEIPTNYGTTASTDIKFLIRDVFFQIIDYAKKAIRLLGRKVFKKSFFIGEVIDWNLDEELRKLNYSARALEWAVQVELFNSSAKISDIEPQTIAQLLHLYCLSEEFCINSVE